MKKLLKWLGLAIAGLIGLLIVAVVLVYVISGSRINQTYSVPVAALDIPADEAALAHGEHIAATRGCADCHGENLGGAVMIDEFPVGLFYGPNLTAGSGGVGATYSDEDWVRALRHGVGLDQKPLLFMPSQEFYYLSDEDLAALIAYLKSVPPVDNPPTESSVGPLARGLFLAGQFPLLPAEVIDHTGPRPDAPAPGVTAEYGQYLAVGCTGCHGENGAGGPIPGAPPDWPPAANLTPSGNLAHWTEAEFISTLRTGVTPEGKELDRAYMPWPNIGRMTDDELKALWLYLKTLPAPAMASSN